MSINMNSFIIGGDFVLPKQESVPFNSLWGDLFEVIQEHDYFFLNIEAPITDCTEAIFKTGPAIKMDESALGPLSCFSNVVASLANNHVLDFGPIGIENTLLKLKEHSIKWLGAGKHIEEAKKPFIISLDGVEVGFINTCETEWCAATASSPGAYTLNIYSLYHQIKELKKLVKYVVLIIHGGSEYYNLPSPERQSLYRLFIDFGFDAIVSHHTHCISGVELYKNKPIIYGLGNLAFPTDNKSPSWNEGMFASFSVTNDYLAFDLIPFKYDNFRLRKLTENEQVDFCERQQTLNSIISDEEMLDKHWRSYATSQLPSILNYLLFPRLISFFCRKLNIEFSFNSFKFKTLNYLRCESHHNVLLTALKEWAGNSGK
ncbi:CapA family protein [Pseudoalteromonas piscicida]|uniref:CapA family protein n=1 Tax=Pseudoalteromonas piscicida TaxID=43662 RepID=UPI001EFC4142|nr:CapA family protein [Pseudoalteromonas piscicida]MCG9771557.1 CapA family protein [Pseudoalteromonas piscicida]